MKKRYENDIIPSSVNRARGEIARQMRMIRKSKDMTQEELANAVGTKKSNISRLESGRYNPSLDFLVKVAGCLGYSLKIELD
ncbi:MAG: helix-turn-helix transcriptional regulator [Lachnospiraceae bacterium]|nr:helix-turn-helix transcriptional regulator [Lachnospiraceae bacterium]